MKMWKTAKKRLKKGQWLLLWKTSSIFLNCCTKTGCVTIKQVTQTVIMITSIMWMKFIMFVKFKGMFTPSFFHTESTSEKAWKPCEIYIPLLSMGIRTVGHIVIFSNANLKSVMQKKVTYHLVDAESYLVANMKMSPLKRANPHPKPRPNSQHTNWKSLAENWGEHHIIG